jgi:eukaryotic-like serine/threonine-protein kinase
MRRPTSLLRKLSRIILKSLVLLLVFLAAALLSMRFAIHGREVRVPKLKGLSPAAAERAANAEGLVLSVESRYYSSDVPQGRIVSQVPAPNATVRRGWKVLVAESLGPQRAAIPNLVGQSRHAATINLTRRGLEVGNVATMRVPGAAAQTVVAQDPPANAQNVASPKIDLLIAAPDNNAPFVMPSFVGKPVAQAVPALEKAGLVAGNGLSTDSVAMPKNKARPPKPLTGTVVKQTPAAGKRVTAGTTVYFEVKK